MVLSSQMGRSGMGRRYMTSRRRRRSKWRWGLALLIIAIALGLWLLPSADSTESSDPSTAGPTDTEPNLATTENTPPPQRTPSPQAMATSVPPDSDLSIWPEAVEPQQATHAAEPEPNRVSPMDQPPSPHVAAWSQVPDRQTTAIGGPLAHGVQLMEDNRLVDARGALNAILIDPTTTEMQAHTVRDKLAQINETLVFSRRIVPGDPLVEAYTVQRGDLLSTIAPKYNIPFQLIERINGISARRIRLGQRIKVIKGPFHAVVHKSEYRMDLFLTDTGGQRVYVRSLTVGLGQDDSTPTGRWVVRRRGRVANPGWTNPRTGKIYAPDDPQNPIGEYWIGLEGNDDNTAGLVGYGIHGTIEPDSIGQQVSMGCVRLRPDDIELVYQVLTGGQSTVVVRQ